MIKECLNKEISIPIAISIIFVLVIIVGGYAWWQFAEIRKSSEIETPITTGEEECKNIQDSTEKAKCYKYLAERTKNEDYCEETELSGMPEIKADCYYALAFLKNDSSLCDKVETALLHSSCLKHFGELVQTGPVELLDYQALQYFQEEVNKGLNSWRLNPLLVAKTDSLQHGFKETDEFILMSKEMSENANTNIVYVEARHRQKVYNIQLIQPVKIGSGGIWIINNIAVQK